MKNQLFFFYNRSKKTPFIPYIINLKDNFGKVVSDGSLTILNIEQDIFCESINIEKMIREVMSNLIMISLKI